MQYIIRMIYYFLLYIAVYQPDDILHPMESYLFLLPHQRMYKCNYHREGAAPKKDINKKGGKRRQLSFLFNTSWASFSFFLSIIQRCSQN